MENSFISVLYSIALKKYVFKNEMSNLQSKKNKSAKNCLCSKMNTQKIIS